jgi:hypothetical protein
VPIKPHEAATYPGYPPVLWSPYLAWQAPNSRGLAVWDRSQMLWRLLHTGDVIAGVVADNAVMLTPEYPLDGSAAFVARLEKVEQFIRERFPQARSL